MNLQELYLSNNRLDFFFSKNLAELSEYNQDTQKYSSYIWPHLTVLDLSNNLGNNQKEIAVLYTANIVR
jgi:hypothetical protein